MDMIKNCSHGVIVATAEDEVIEEKDKEGKIINSYFQPRANVIQEIGLCHSASA